MISNTAPTFVQDSAQEIWTDYLRRVEALCDSLDRRQKLDILTELKAHLLESYIRFDDGDEEQRITAAIAKLGEPGEFVPLWVEERLLDGAQPGASTRNLFFLMKGNALKGVQQFLFSMAVGFGYLLSFFLFVMAILKIAFPDNVGLYLSPSGFPFLGYVDADGFTEILGYWLTPLGLCTGIALQLFLNRRVAKRVRRERH